MLTAEAKVTRCPSCEAELQGPFCHQCGQRHLSGAPTLKQLWTDTRNRLSDWERGFFRTVWQLLAQPGLLVREVLRGKRKGYNHPLTFLLICATASVLTAQLYDEAFW